MNTPPAAPAGQNDTAPQAQSVSLAEAGVRALRSNQAINAPVNIVAALAIAAGLQLLDQPAGLVWWVWLMVGIQIVRLLPWFRPAALLRQSQPMQADHLESELQRLRAGVALSAAAWGCLYGGIFARDLPGQLFLCFAAAAVSGGGVASLSADLNSARLLALLQLLPLAARLFAQAQSVTVLLGALCLGYCLFILLAARQIHRSFHAATDWRHRARWQSESLRASELRFRTMFDESPDPVWIVRNDRFINCNQAAVAILGYPDKASLLGSHPADLSPPLQPDGEASKDKADRMIEAAMQRPSHRFEWMHRDAAGRDFWVEVTLSTIQLDGERVLYCVWRDIQARKEAEAKLRYQVLHDPLTDLPNRWALELRLPQLIREASGRQQSLAIAMLDLDDFKPVNDLHGHNAGDTLLRGLGDRLRHVVRPPDLLARLGGDEFVAVFTGLLRSDEQRNGFVTPLTHLHNAIAHTPFEIGPGRTATVGASIGVALYPDHGDEADDLLRKADAALYVAKAQKPRKGRWWSVWSADLVPWPDVSDAERRPAVFGGASADLLHGFLQSHPEFIERVLATCVRQTPNRPSEVRQADDTGMAVQLRQLLEPGLNGSELIEAWNRQGRTDFWTGNSESDGQSVLIQVLASTADAITQLPWRTTDRLTLHHLISARCVLALRAHRSGRETMQRQRQELLLRVQENSAAWCQMGEFHPRLMLALTAIDDILGVGAGRPDGENHYVLEFAEGPAATVLHEMLIHAPEFSMATEERTPSLLEPTYRAWFFPGVHSRLVATGDPDDCLSRAASGQAGIATTAAFAINDASGHPVLVITVLGGVAGQFDSGASRLWLEAIRNLAQRGEDDSAERRHSAPVSLQSRAHYRSLLFGQGLAMEFQPIVRLGSGELVKVEALARLCPADGVRVRPGEFLAGFGTQELRRLFRSGLTQTLEALAGWDAAGLKIGATVNIPPMVLMDPQCADWVAQALQEHGIAPHRLHLELLEVGDAELGDQQLRSLAQLRSLNVRLVMDDLGAGFSSLQRLRSLPFDIVKVDQNLVSDAHLDGERTVPFIGSLVRMAQGLGVEVVVEGLGADDLVEMAACLGAEYGQGYAIAEPMRASDIPAWNQSRQWPIDPPSCRSTLGRSAYRFARALPPDAAMQVPPGTLIS